MYMIPYTTSRRSSSSLMDLFDEFERSVFGENGRRTPAFSTDIRDEGAHYLLQAELPGFSKEDIDLDVKDGILTISATHEQSEEQKKDNYICRERRYGSFQRSFNLEGIQEDQICASYQNGVLELTLPKRQEVLPQSRKIAIS
jgi:HSP20 family protein